MEIQLTTNCESTMFGVVFLYICQIILFCLIKHFSPYLYQVERLRRPPVGQLSGTVIGSEPCVWL